MPTLLLVRHAIAEPRGEDWPDDALRPLTPAGASRMRDIAARLLAIDEIAGVVLTSPLARARQTARVLADEWTPTPIVSVLEALAPGHTPAMTATALGTLTAPARVALVGHEPELGVFAAWLIGARSPLTFKKGGVARIDVPSWPPSRGGSLIWLAQPKMLRAKG